VPPLSRELLLGRWIGDDLGPGLVTLVGCETRPVDVYHDSHNDSGGGREGLYCMLSYKVLEELLYEDEDTSLVTIRHPPTERMCGRT
jgi:hypothetical protein